MDDFRTQIPQSAFINAQVIHDAMIDGDLRRSLAKWRTHYNIPDLSLINPAHVASLLYCLIVVPKEVWDPPSNDDVYKLIDMCKPKPLDLFTIRTWAPPTEHPVRDFLRHLRNAISHVKFSVDSEYNFEFWDNKRNGVENYRVVITLDNLAKFLTLVGAQLANLRSR
jgi:hypothetical protein